MIPPLYLIEKSYPSGTEITGTRNTTLNTLVKDIEDGQHEDIVKIIECFEDENSCRDVTEDIARAVRDHLHTEQVAPSYELASWIQEQLGLNAIVWRYDMVDLREVG